MTATDPEVALVFFDGCPHVEAARENLRSACHQVGRGPLWREWDLAGPDTPAHLSGHPSPTILVAGLDVCRGAPHGGGLACRAGGAPSVDDIVAALVRP